MGAAYAGMGIAVGDADNDGLLDLYVTHLTAETNTFWKQGPRGQFQDLTAIWAAPAKWRGTGFGTLMVDFDLDGFPDLAVANGRVSKDVPHPAPGVAPFWEPYTERNQIFANDGGKRFRDVSPQNAAFCGTPQRRPRSGLCRSRWRRGARPRRDDGGRARPSVPERVSESRALARDPGAGPETEPGRVRGRNHGPRRPQSLPPRPQPPRPAICRATTPWLTSASARRPHSIASRCCGRTGFERCSRAEPRTGSSSCPKAAVARRGPPIQ